MNDKDILEMQRLTAKNFEDLTPEEADQLAEWFDQKEHQSFKRFDALKDATEKDEPNLQADDAIQLRLRQAMEMQPKKPDVKRNSFFDMVMALFGVQNLGIKVAMASIMIVGLLWFGQKPSGSVESFLIDTTTTQLADTSLKAWYDTSMVNVHFQP